MFRKKNDAVAYVEGRGGALHGRVTFRQKIQGVLVTVEIYGLPVQSKECGEGVFGFHIHEGAGCGGTEQDPFSESKGHYNPSNCPHPYHAGDLPPLFSDNGYAYLSVMTGRFSVEEIIGKTVIIHDHPDDFTTQPAGNSGRKMACGVIERLR